MVVSTDSDKVQLNLNKDKITEDLPTSVNVSTQNGPIIPKPNLLGLGCAAWFVGLMNESVGFLNQCWGKEVGLR